MDDRNQAGLREAARGYLRESRSFAFSIVSMLPLIVLYHCGIVQAGYGQRNMAELWLAGPLRLLGVEAAQILNIAVLVAIVAALWRSPRSEWLHWRTAAIMIAEACLYAAILYAGVPALAGLVARRASGLVVAASLGGFGHVLLAVGAGVYEELFFRLLMLGAGAWTLQRICGWKAFWSVTATLLTSSFLFAGVHHLGPLGEPLESYRFVFRTLCGLLLGIVFLSRGLGVAAWTHAIYNGLVLLQEGFS